MFPLLGTVPAAGLTPSELAGALTRRLAAGYLREPRVTVTLDAARSRRVFVVGAVRSPGAYTLDGPVRLLEVLALAGSATRDAYGEVVLSRRDRAGVPMVAGLDALGGDLEGGVPPGRVLNLEALQAGRAGDDIVLRDGDLVYVRPAGRVFVRGQVTDPGEYPLRVGMTVRQTDRFGRRFHAVRRARPDPPGTLVRRAGRRASRHPPHPRGARLRAPPGRHRARRHALVLSGPARSCRSARLPAGTPGSPSYRRRGPGCPPCVL